MLTPGQRFLVVLAIVGIGCADGPDLKSTEDAPTNQLPPSGYSHGEPSVTQQAINSYSDPEGYIYRWYCAIIPCPRIPERSPGYEHPWVSGNADVCEIPGSYPSVQLFTGPDMNGWCVKRDWGGPGETFFGEPMLSRGGMDWNDKARSIFATGVAVLLVYRERDYGNQLHYIVNPDPFTPIELRNLSEVSSIFVVWH